MASTKPLAIEVEDLLMGSFLDHSTPWKSPPSHEAQLSLRPNLVDKVPSNETVVNKIFVNQSMNSDS